jgi:hypothetical protein
LIWERTGTAVHFTALTGTGVTTSTGVTLGEVFDPGGVGLDEAARLRRETRAILALRQPNISDRSARRNIVEVFCYFTQFFVISLFDDEMTVFFQKNNYMLIC